MIEIVYRFDPEHPPSRIQPADAEEARKKLEVGNYEFAVLLDPRSGHAVDGSVVVPFDLQDIGIDSPGNAPRQQPFAAILGCADARVPTELIFSRGCNEMFVVRVAGNVLSRDGLGSMDYAVENLRGSLRLLVVLGHSQCGAVTAAADAFLNPSSYLNVANNHPIRSIVNTLFPAVRTAADTLERTWGRDIERKPGYRLALIETAIIMNAAMTARMLMQELSLQQPNPLKVVYGIYDLVSRRVHVPRSVEKSPTCLVEPPLDAAGFLQLGTEVARSSLIQGLLGFQ
ncbi:MAG: hypothetical protein K8T89_08750 [Planctomycetes bacterium]|nr:hypothetical protein [Planctomycetota bacterium]